MDLEETVERLAPCLLRYCRGRSGDPGLAEELAQEALAALVGRWRRHGPPESPEAFAFGIARRRIGRALVRRRLLAPLEAALGARSERPGPGERAEVRAELAAVARALRRLPVREREALLLVAAGELALAPAARVLGISVPALKMRLHRGRKRLGEVLAEADEARSREVPHAFERA